uniref:Prolyl 4-hydroxylase alpha subunit Fe(2+) 2OG dioxygenase domain-containing protein n=1 Tax=Noctiluca scintillans TaxID=2966 RepID=A0A7S1F4E0_NOCSC|mmetsp:Transcript_31439/g.83739  ORF Transcript_31439/g.83739 Transcript_31439/m.83739 type:complete len:304 (+) Transcript_31439:60-971(+)
MVAASSLRLGIGRALVFVTLAVTDLCPAHELLRDDALDPTSGLAHSTVQVLWATQVEVVPLSAEEDGFEPVFLHQSVNREALRFWKEFKTDVYPALGDHPCGQSRLDVGGSFSCWQRQLSSRTTHAHARGGSTSNTTWPAMEVLPEYHRLRSLVDRLSRRFLQRSGMNNADDVELSIANRVAVQRGGAFNEPRSNTGEYVSGIFFASVGEGAGQLLLQDPRGTSPPFNGVFSHIPRSGELVLFPSWLSHMTTVTAKNSRSQVMMFFNVGPVEGPLKGDALRSDPTGGFNFTRHSPFEEHHVDL